MSSKSRLYVYLDIKSIYTGNVITNIRVPETTYLSALDQVDTDSQGNQTHICIRFRKAAGLECFVGWHQLTIVAQRSTTDQNPIDETSITDKSYYEALELFDKIPVPIKTGRNTRKIAIGCECVPFQASY